MPRIDIEGLRIAESDQRESELRTLAGLLGGYRARLLEAGFSQRESFTLLERFNERAVWAHTGAGPDSWSDWNEDDE